MVGICRRKHLVPASCLHVHMYQAPTCNQLFTHRYLQAQEKLPGKIKLNNVLLKIMIALGKAGGAYR